MWITFAVRFCLLLSSWMLLVATVAAAEESAQAGPIASKKSDKATAVRPNIVWISIEDISPDLGCYGDAYAKTPVIDAFAARSVRYTHAFTHAGVCAPSRSGIITGMYPTSIGTHHMRCKTVLPPGVRCFTEYLRQAGYYCTNQSKTDYQFDVPEGAWDANGPKAHWNNLASDQPFFAVFNLTNTHESQIRNPARRAQNLKLLSPAERHDPAQAVLPPYYPDTPKVRRDCANYHDNITATEKQLAEKLDEIARSPAADDTIIWIWGDHGRGLPRGKRWLYDSGTRIPLLVYMPEKLRQRLSPPDQLDTFFKPGSVNDELVAAVDFAPTVLMLAGLLPPKHIQGRSSRNDYVYGARDRMDERYDVIRSVRDRRYKYIRNFMPHLSQSQHVSYGDLMPTMQELRRLNATSELSPAAAIFFAKTKPVEELYDTQTDPHEIDNIAVKPEQAERLAAMRAELERWMLETRDLGLIPEPELDELQRPGGKPPASTSADKSWQASIRDEDLQRLLKLKSLDFKTGTTASPEYLKALNDPSAAMRYWAVIGLRNMYDEKSVPPNVSASILKLIDADKSPVVRVEAALTRAQWYVDFPETLLDLLTHPQPSLRLHAALALDELDKKASVVLPEMKQQLDQQPTEYVQRVLTHAVKELEASSK